MHYAPAMMLPMWAGLRAPSSAFVRRTREARYGVRLEELAVGQARVDGWTKAREGFTRIKGWIGEGGEGSRWIMGDAVTYADFIPAAFLMWVRQMAPEDWKEVLKWDDGFWAAFVKELEERYVVYDEGEEYKPE